MVLIVTENYSFHILLFQRFLSSCSVFVPQLCVAVECDPVLAGSALMTLCLWKIEDKQKPTGLLSQSWFLNLFRGGKLFLHFCLQLNPILLFEFICATYVSLLVLLVHCKMTSMQSSLVLSEVSVTAPHCGGCKCYNSLVSCR